MLPHILWEKHFPWYACTTDCSLVVLLTLYVNRPQVKGRKDFIYTKDQTWKGIHGKWNSGSCIMYTLTLLTKANMRSQFLCIGETCCEQKAFPQ